MIKLNKDAQALLQQAQAAYQQIKTQEQQAKDMLVQLMRSYGLNPEKVYSGPDEAGVYTEVKVPNG